MIDETPPYSEGDWFAVPLRIGRYATGVVARSASGGILLGYFFGPRRVSIPTVNEVVQAAAKDSVLVERFADLGIIQHEWPIIGATPNWNRDSWPVPRTWPMMVKNARYRFFGFKPDSASIASAASIHASSFGPSSA